MNDDLMVKTLARIERDPETWNQGSWGWRNVCNTTFCLAGHAAMASGAKLRWLTDGSVDFAPALLHTVDGRAVGSWAQEALDLSADEAEELFYAPTNLAIVYDRVADIMGVEVQVLRDKVRSVV